MTNTVVTDSRCERSVRYTPSRQSEQCGEAEECGGYELRYTRRTPLTDRVQWREQSQTPRLTKQSESSVNAMESLAYKTDRR